MTREETLGVLAVLKAAYPGFYRDMKRSEADGIVSLWTEMFRDEPAQLVGMAVKAYIASDRKGFPPHIGAIRDAICRLREPEEMTELEAWSLVSRAARNGIWGAQEEFDKLPPVLQRLVGSPEQLRVWAMMDQDEVASVVASNFQRSYKARAARERELMALPAEVKQAMAQLAGAMDLPRLTE